MTSFVIDDLTPRDVSKSGMACMTEPPMGDLFLIDDLADSDVALMSAKRVIRDGPCRIDKPPRISLRSSGLQRSIDVVFHIHDAGKMRCSPRVGSQFNCQIAREQTMLRIPILLGAGPHPWPSFPY